MVVDEVALDKLQKRPPRLPGGEEQELEDICSDGIPSSESEASD